MVILQILYEILPSTSILQKAVIHNISPFYITCAASTPHVSFPFFREDTDCAVYMFKYDRLTWEDVTNCDDDEYYSGEVGVMSPNEHPITQMGDNIVTWSYIKDYIYRGNDRFAFQLADNFYGEIEFEIELADNEDFDPKKLQLIWDAHEIRVIDYGYVADCIVYDGKIYGHCTDYPDHSDYYSGCYLYDEELEDGI